MKTILTRVCIILLFSLQKQNRIVHSTIKTQYLTSNRDTDKNHIKPYWEPMHKVASGGFECQWLPNGDLSVKYNNNDKPMLLNRRDDLRKTDTDHIPLSINGFNRFGIYSDPEQPDDMFYVYYINPAKPNSLLIQFYSFAGYVIFAADYFSDESVNPFEKMTLIWNDHKVHGFKLN